ncbi:hypothetical protein BGZ95_004335 [Linnemannia exigua]|uniref:F-box domain-containing protein n=1 Tax=Linnemannia exigua TaxID=604196 RepID=A0AAD4H1S0_9FUNG|nr:hypothetical protein BGZ95_004335 [Linnemannia exigua]
MAPKSSSGTWRKTPMQDALSLSEIRTHIGYFLITNKKDLIACMSVCKDWRTDFRRLLFSRLVLTNRTFQPILTAIQWRAYGMYTQSLVLEEPAIMQKVNSTQRGSDKYGSVQGRSSSTVLRSSDYNLDAIQHCPNLLHLSIRLSSIAQGLCCWTREDDNDDGLDDNDSGYHSLATLTPARYRTSVAFRYDRQNVPWFVKSSNRVLALLEYHPNLRSFHWIGDSNVHLERIGRHLLSKQHHLVDLQMDALTATCSETNRIIENCPSLRRLSLRTLHLVPTATWPDLGTEQEDATTTTTSSTTTTTSPPSFTQQILNLSQIQSLTLDQPQFLTPGAFKVNGPALQHLDLIDCAFPPSFLADVERARIEGTPSALTLPYVVEWTCPQLTTFKHDRGSLMPEAFTYNLLTSAQHSIRSLTLLRLTLQPTFVSDLIANNICQKLTYLDLSGSERIKSTDIQWLLCHCQDLLEFKGPAGVLWGEDLFQSTKHWVCRKLQKLQMLICLARPDSGLWDTDPMLLGFPLWDAPPADSNRLLQVQKTIFKQLGQLTDLEVMDLSGGHGIEQFLHEVPRGLPWTLDAGLDLLKDLGRMRELTVSGWENKMTRKEAQWFRQWWPELRLFRTRNDSALARRPHHGQQQPRQQQAADKPVREELVVGWLAFQMCLHQEWPDRFPDPQ